MMDLRPAGFSIWGISIVAERRIQTNLTAGIMSGGQAFGQLEGQSEC